MKYIYVSYRTKDTFVNNITEKPSYDIVKSYSNIKKNKNRWGFFLVDKNKIIGNSEIMYEEDSGKKYGLLVWVFIENQYREKKLCYEIVKRTIIKNEKKKNNLIKVVIAGGFPILKCLIKVFEELKYKIKKYNSSKEDITNLKLITYEQALEIEKKNYKYDKWQTLFFEK
jgi:hypothetical protein